MKDEVMVIRYLLKEIEETEESIKDFKQKHKGPCCWLPPRRKGEIIQYAREIRRLSMKIQREAKNMYKC